MLSILRILPLTLSALALMAADPAGPFSVLRRNYNADTPNPAFIARDGTIESASLTSGDASAGLIGMHTWSGDHQAGGRGVGAVNLIGPVGSNFFLGLRKDWRIGEGADAGGTWCYYTKFQQDLLFVAGFADCDPSILPTADGSGFSLDAALPYNRIVLVLPWRWVQGGGSSYQRGTYNGNPPEAGIWSVSAGVSLSTAQAAPAINCLAGMDAILAEIQPHAYTTAFKLQILGGGRWQLAIDINDDGVTDLDVDSAQTGNKPSPFAAMTERSGLIVSHRGAMGSGTGLVGRTDVNLTYRASPTDEVATADLANRRPFSVNLPTSTKSSPVIIDGQAWGKTYAVTASASTLGPNPVPVSRIADQQFFLDVPLEVENATLVTFAQTGTPQPSTVNGWVWWEPVNMYTNEAVTIRVGDKIKLRCSITCGNVPVEIDADGDGTIDYTGTEVDSFVHQYPTAGVYTAKAYRPGETTPIGTATVTVTEVRLPKVIACQVGFTRTVDIHTGLYNPESLVVTSNDTSLMTVTRGTTADNHLRVFIKPLKRGSLILQVQRNGANGTVLAVKPIDEFTLSTLAMQNLVIENASGLAQGAIVMTPHIPGISIAASTFANKASFVSGKDMTGSTDECELVSDGVETSGVFSIAMNIPQSSDSFCMSVNLYQNSEADNVPGQEVNPRPPEPPAVIGGTPINGTGCRLSVPELTFCCGIHATKALSIMCHQKGNGHQDHLTNITRGTGATSATLPTITGPVICPVAPPAKPAAPPAPATTFDVKVSDAVGLGKYNVLIGGKMEKGKLVGATVFSDKIKVRKCELIFVNFMQRREGRDLRNLNANFPTGNSLIIDVTCGDARQEIGTMWLSDQAIATAITRNDANLGELSAKWCPDHKIGVSMSVCYGGNMQQTNNALAGALGPATSVSGYNSVTTVSSTTPQANWVGADTNATLVTYPNPQNVPNPLPPPDGAGGAPGASPISLGDGNTSSIDNMATQIRDHVRGLGQDDVVRIVQIHAHGSYTANQNPPPANLFYMAVGALPLENAP